MNHEQAVPWILDMHTGRLDPARSTDVAEHARGCDHCRKILDVYDAMESAMTRGATAHPGIDDLVGYAMDDSELTVDMRGRVDEHAGSCRTCSEEIAAVRSAEGSLGTIERRPSENVVAFPARRMHYLAAGLAAALVLSLGYIGLFQGPGGAQAPEAGAVSLPLFSGALRSGDDATVITIGSASGSIPLAIAPSLPRDLPDATPLRLEIAAGGRTTFSLEMTAEEIRELGAASGVLAVIVPTEAFAEGEHRLVLLDVRRELPLLEQTFSVTRSSP